MDLIVMYCYSVDDDATGRPKVRSKFGRLKISRSQRRTNCNIFLLFLLLTIALMLSSAESRRRNCNTITVESHEFKMRIYLYMYTYINATHRERPQLPWEIADGLWSQSLRKTTLLLQRSLRLSRFVFILYCRQYTQ